MPDTGDSFATSSDDSIPFGSQRGGITRLKAHFRCFNPALWSGRFLLEMEADSPGPQPLVLR